MNNISNVDTLEDPRNPYLKKRFHKIQGDARIASVYTAARMEEGMEQRREKMIRSKKRARTTFQKLRAECYHDAFYRDKTGMEYQIQEELNRAKRVKLPVQNVLEVLHLATEFVEETNCYMSVLPLEVAELVACYVVS